MYSHVWRREFLTISGARALVRKSTPTHNDILIKPSYALSVREEPAEIQSWDNKWSECGFSLSSRHLLPSRLFSFFFSCSRSLPWLYRRQAYSRCFGSLISDAEPTPQDFKEFTPSREDRKLRSCTIANNTLIARILKKKNNWRILQKKSMFRWKSLRLEREFITQLFLLQYITITFRRNRRILKYPRKNWWIFANSFFV